MGREVKRVALDFDWPLKKVWKGFINDRPNSTACAACEGTGYSPAAKAISDQWYGFNGEFKPSMNGSAPFTHDNPTIRAKAEWNTSHIYKEPDGWVDTGKSSEWAIKLEAAYLCDHFNSGWSYHLNDADVAVLLKEGRLSDFTRYPRTKEQKAEYEANEKYNDAEREKPVGERNCKFFNNGYIPSAQEVNEWSISGFGHDSINHWICVKAKCKRLKIPINCPQCKGSGEIWSSPQAKKFYNAWKSTEPPAGKGWQMWETVSEGSPISPVCKTPEELAHWLADNKASCGSSTATYDEWLKMIDVGWAMTAMTVNGKFMDGVKAYSELQEKKLKKMKSLSFSNKRKNDA